MIEPNPFILQYIRKQPCWIFFGTSANPFLYFLPAVYPPYAVLLIHIKNQFRGSVAEGVSIGRKSIFRFRLWCRFSILIFDFVIIHAYYKAGGGMKGYSCQCISVEGQLFRRGCIWCECNGRKFWAVVVPYDAAKRSEILNVFLINISQDIPHFGQRIAGADFRVQSVSFLQDKSQKKASYVPGRCRPSGQGRLRKRKKTGGAFSLVFACGRASFILKRAEIKYLLWKV